MNKMKAYTKLKKNSHKKILLSFFIGSLNLGGTEKQVVNLINSLDKKKFKIQLHLLSERGDLFKEVDKSVKIFLPKFKFKFKFKHVLNFFVNFYRIKKTKPEIIHCFLPFAYLMGGVIGILLKHQNIVMSRRSLNNYHNNFNFFPVKKIEKFLHKRIKLIIANANAVKKNIIEEDVNKEKVKVIYNGFVKPKTIPNESLNEFKKKLGVKKNCFIFLVLANLIPYKNHKLVIEAVHHLSKFVEKDFKVIFLGSGKSEYKKFLKNLITKKMIEKFFIFRDKTEHTQSYLNITNVGISSSLEEGLSNSLIEFISFGIPTIATRVGGSEEITNNRNGFLIKSNSTKQLITAMQVLMFDKKLLRLKSKESLKDSIKFSLDKMVENHTMTYKELINS